MKGFDIIAEKTKYWKVIVTVLAALVVFVTAYMLILPAITLDEDTAETQSGMDVSSQQDADETDAPESTDTAEAVEETESDDEESVGSVSDADNQENQVQNDTDEQNADAGQQDEAAEEEAMAAAENEVEDAAAVQQGEGSISDGGKTYKIEVSYDDKAGIPEDAVLSVEEITSKTAGYNEYMARTEEAIGKGRTVEFARFFDIKILSNGEEIQPEDNVDVRIELADNLKKEDVKAIHFGDAESDKDEAEDVLLETKVKKDEDGTAVSFSTGGFSAYAIVEGPEAVPLGWKRIESMQDLLDHASSGVYMGHPDGFFFTNEPKDDANRKGIKKTKPAQSYPPTNKAAKYYFEPAGTDGMFYAYCKDRNDNKKYVYNNGNNSLSFTDGPETAFKVTIDDSGIVRVNNGDWYWNMQGGANGERFCSWNSATDTNARLNFWYYEEVTEDPYHLDGKAYGLMNWSGAASGKAMMAEPAQGQTVPEGALPAKALTVMAKKNNNEDKLFVPSESNISFWKFDWIEEDRSDTYYITTTIDGSLRYLSIDEDGLSLVQVPDSSCKIHVTPGEGAHKGQISLQSGGTTLTYSGNADNGFTVEGSAGAEWLYLVEESELTQDYFMTYSAEKVSVSDTNHVANGSRIIVYTRAWNEDTKRYDFFAINHDGTLVRCYESGDSIEWVMGQINTLLWDFVEYTDNQGRPNGYYELYNEYSEKYLAPQMTGNQIVSDDTIGLSLPGRRDGKYYSSILAWDDPDYTYAGYKVENGQIVPCKRPEAMDFYFAVMEDIPIDDEIHTVPTIDHTQYGITMKIKDFDSRQQMYEFIGNDDGGAVYYTQPGLLSTSLNENGYPTATITGRDMKTFFANEKEVNHLFIDSTYRSSGYYEFDSTQNFASLKGKTGGDFTVYKELGTYDSIGARDTLKHGQFFPFNDIEPGLYAAVNGKNLYSATGKPLPNTDPRKNEQLYLIKDVDCYYGVELEASFVQTPSGLDAWGHDIIYEFTGDDDFWLYVDGQLVIDLGGIHSALPGTVNFKTGEVTMAGGKNQSPIHTTLRDIFYNNYIEQGHTPQQAEEYVNGEEYENGLFIRNDEGQWIFKSNTTHTMNIFYLERGGGAANLHMRFNLASVKPGTVQLSKDLSGVDSSETILAEFPYQIKYKRKDDPTEYYLKNSPGTTENYVFYKDTTTPVEFKDHVTIDGITYDNVFMLKPTEIAEINFPTWGDDPAHLETIESYSIVECGINTNVYDEVTVNGTEVSGTPVPGHDRADYDIGYDTTKQRAVVAYDNHVDPDALRTLTIKKKLYDETGEHTEDHELHNEDAVFDFRLYLGTEFDETVDNAPANMHIYHVKDENGYYCKWVSEDEEHGHFEVIGGGITDYDDLTKQQKKDASFDTSINGSMSRIPAFYTVEVRNVLAGTKYRVEERPWEVPDGYSFQEYEKDATAQIVDRVDPNTGAVIPGVVDVIHSRDEGGYENEPNVNIDNLKGWGLRVNKVWTDKDYMSGRDATYFAIFIDDGQGNLTLLDGSVRILNYSDSQTLYWYFEHLPAVSSRLSDYKIREVKLTGDHIEVDDEGVVTGYDTITPINDGDELKLKGTQKGETIPSDFTYTITNQEGTISSNSNVRVDTVTNDRSGIILKKTTWDGETPLEGAEFTLKKGEDEIGTFTSDEDGLITVAFLSDNVDYTLTETKTPQEYHGLQEPITIRLQNQGGTSTVVVSGADEEYYEVTQAQGGKSAVVTVKDRHYGLTAVKKDADTDQPMKNVKFALHKQVTVGGVTSFDLNPIPGYESLITDNNGVIPKIDNTLPAGVYELRETTPSGYERLSSYIHFNVSATGNITLNSEAGNPKGVALTADKTGTYLEYTLTIVNTKPRKLKFKKIDVGVAEKVLAGAVFDLYKLNGSDREKLYEGMTSGSDGILVYKKTPSAAPQTLFELSEGTYHLVETQAPDGYNLKENPVVITISLNDSGELVVMYDDGTAAFTGSVTPGPDGVYLLEITNTSGVELPESGGAGTAALYILGGLLILLASAGLLARRRRMN